MAAYYIYSDKHLTFSIVNLATYTDRVNLIEYQTVIPNLTKKVLFEDTSNWFDAKSEKEFTVHFGLLIKILTKSPRLALFH